MTRFVSFATGCLMLTAIAGFVATSQSTALAQTVPPQKGKKETTGGKQMGTAKLTADGAATYLRNKGHKVEKMLDPSGAPILSVLMKDNDGWSFDIRIEFSPDQRTYLLSSRLGKAGAKYTAQQLEAILKANFSNPTQVYFLLQPDGQLGLSTCQFSADNASDNVLQADLDLLTGTIRKTEPVWNVE